MQQRYRVRMPLNQALQLISNESALRQAAEKKMQAHRHMIVLKPARSLGAPWIDSYVARRQNVNLCEMCWRKYHDWWKTYGYQGQFAWVKRSDCDGCGAEQVLVIGFYPEERYRQSIIRY